MSSTEAATAVPVTGAAPAPAPAPAIDTASEDRLGTDGPLLGFAPRLVLSVVGGQPSTCSPKPVRPAGSRPSFRCSEGIS